MSVRAGRNGKLLLRNFLHGILIEADVTKDRGTGRCAGLARLVVSSVEIKGKIVTAFQANECQLLDQAIFYSRHASLACSLSAPVIGTLGMRVDFAGHFRKKCKASFFLRLLVSVVYVDAVTGWSD